MSETIEILNHVLPVPLLIGLGYYLRRSGFLKESTIGDARKIILKISLPAVLFLSFLELELEAAYAAVFVFMFLFCLLLFGAGILTKKISGLKEEYLPYLLTGFEYGMLGISLYGTAFGIDNIGPIAVVALGHEIFIWFLFLPLLLRKRREEADIGGVLSAFFRSPVIIAIILSLLLNAAGAGRILKTLPVAGAIMNAAGIAGTLTVPLILIIVGYQIHIAGGSLRKAAIVSVVRLAVLIPSAILVNQFFIRNVLGLPPVFEDALFAFFILPPPFIIPLYAKPDLDTDERSFISNTLTIHTALSICVFILYFLFRS